MTKWEPGRICVSTEGDVELIRNTRLKNIDVVNKLNSIENTQSALGFLQLTQFLFILVVWVVLYGK